MAKQRIEVNREQLMSALQAAPSAAAASRMLNLSFMTFKRRCVEHNVYVTNAGGKGLTAIQRYGEDKAKILSDAQSVLSKARVFSEDTRDKLRTAALRRIDEGKVPSKGLKGYYNSIWFDSSWELAYYLWMSEVNSIEPIRNTKIWFDYLDDAGIKRRTKPDFVLPSGELIEIKGYPNIHTTAKYSATKDKVTYLFRCDLKDALQFVRTKYGREFTKMFYASVA